MARGNWRGWMRRDPELVHHNEHNEGTANTTRPGRVPVGTSSGCSILRREPHPDQAKSDSQVTQAPWNGLDPGSGPVVFVVPICFTT